MKKGVLVLVVAMLAGVAAFCLMRSHKMTNPHGTLLDEMPELAWLRSELSLSDEQFAEVSRLHANYRPQCVEMCHRIEMAHERLEAATQSTRSVSPELKAAIADHARIHADCQEAMVEHLYQTAATLDEKQAERYLTTMLPYALDFSNSEPKAAQGHAR